MEFLIVILVLLAVYVIYVYNSLMRSKIRVDEALSDIDVQLKRRYDLIPNLIEAVKGYVKQEKSTLEEITELRQNAMKEHQSGDIHKSAAAEDKLSKTLGGLMVQVENYPDLKSNQNFLDLQNDLQDTEDKIQAARRFYNGNVRDYNTKVHVFPSNLVANAFKYVPREFFEVANEAERENVKVKF